MKNTLTTTKAYFRKVVFTVPVLEIFYPIYIFISTITFVALIAGLAVLITFETLIIFV